MSLVVRVYLVAAFCLLAACGEFIVDDQDFSDNRRNLDVTNDNAEEYLWSSYHAIYSPLYASRLHELLDARYFGTTQSGKVGCAHGGTAKIGFPNAVFGAYEEGDDFNLAFYNCSQVGGVVLNGAIRGSYQEISGYNTAFVDSITEDACIAELTEQDFDGVPTVIADQASTLVFDKQGARLFMRYLEPDPDDPLGKDEISTYELSLNEEAIVINRSATLPDSASKEDGAEYYIVKDGEHELVDCAFYEREVELVLTAFKVAAQGLVHTLDGTLELSNAFYERDRRDYHIQSDRLKSSFTLANLTEGYDLRDLSWRVEYGQAVDTNYAVAFSAEAESVSDGVVFEPRTGAFRGTLGEPNPKNGIMVVDGKDDQNTAMNIISALSVTIAIEAEGDQDGDGRGDKTAPNFDLTWKEFLDRDFVRPPVQEIE